MSHGANQTYQAEQICLSHKKREVAVQRIVILTSGAEPNEALGGWLNRLFPECEREMVSKENKTFDQGEGDCSYEGLRIATTGRP